MSAQKTKAKDSEPKSTGRTEKGKEESGPGRACARCGHEYQTHTMPPGGGCVRVGCNCQAFMY